MDALPPGAFAAGLPAGTIEYCTGVALALAALGGWWRGTPLAASGVGVAIQVRLPEVMAASYGSTFEMRPPPPVQAPGGGWLHADLGAAGDRELFDQLMATLPLDTAAAGVARAAQEWRLPVCDYRSRSVEIPSPPFRFETEPVPADRATGHVLDLTAMWAGPLATWLLQDLGCRVVKVEPSFRPDGFRALDGRGIHPEGRQCDPGADSAMWNALNYGKQVVDLDLRQATQFDAFLALAAESDVVIDTFSPRVMANFGLDVTPGGATRVAMPAFGGGPERDWVAYGSGVHAASGLGDLGDGRYAPPAVSYPDPVGGFLATLAALAAIVGRARHRPVAGIVTSLATAIGPLVSLPPDPGPMRADPAGIGAALLDLGGSLDLVELRPVRGTPRWHPRTVFQTKQNVF